MEIRRTGPHTVWVTEGAWTEPTCIPDLAAALGVTVPTVYRWAAGGALPATAELALRGRIIGEVLHPKWRGWRTTPDGRLWAPNGYGWMPAELEAWQHVFITNELLWRARERDRRDNSPEPHALHQPAQR